MPWRCVFPTMQTQRRLGKSPRVTSMYAAMGLEDGTAAVIRPNWKSCVGAFINTTHCRAPGFSFPAVRVFSAASAHAIQASAISSSLSLCAGIARANRLHSSAYSRNVFESGMTRTAVDRA
jgi:hypothetical protein